MRSSSARFHPSPGQPSTVRSGSPARRRATVAALLSGLAPMTATRRHGCSPPCGGPRAQVEGWPGEGWNLALEDRIVGTLQEFRPDFVIVGLGMPLQEEFLSRHWEELPTAIYAAVGGVIDQYSGIQKSAPRWLGPLGLEWAYRLATQPRRLGHRYLVEPWILAYLLAAKAVRQGTRGADASS